MGDRKGTLCVFPVSALVIILQDPRLPQILLWIQLKEYNKGQIERVQELRQGDDCTSIFKVCQMPGSSQGSSVLWFTQETVFILMMFPSVEWKMPCSQGECQDQFKRAVYFDVWWAWV